VGGDQIWAQMMDQKRQANLRAILLRASRLRAGQSPHSAIRSSSVNKINNTQDKAGAAATEPSIIGDFDNPSLNFSSFHIGKLDGGSRAERESCKGC